MDAQSGSSSHPEHVSVAASFHELSSFADLPELDDGLSSGGYSSEYLSTGDASLVGPELEFDEGMGHMEVDEEENEDEEGGGVDGVSLYTPSRHHHPVLSIYQQPLQPFDDGATVNSNRSIAPSDVEYIYENGRRYCGSYYMPNDKPEQIRQLLVHEVYKGAFNNEPTSVPLDNPTHILDVGAGTGEWAIDMADHYSDCEVTGTDIADVFPRFVAPNLFWEIDNAELEWIRAPDTYDLVHFRNMAGAFSDWPYVYKQAFRVVKPGGWIELLDFDDHQGFRNFFSFFEEDSPIHKIARELSEASLASGRPRGVKHLEPALLYDAGFVSVRLTEHAIPISPKEMSTGHLFLKALMEGMEATILRLLTTYKGWTAADVRDACALMSQELKEMALDRERAKGFVVKVRVLTGRKPAGVSLLELGSTFDTENMAVNHNVQVDSMDGNFLHHDGGHCIPINVVEHLVTPSSQCGSFPDQTRNYGNECLNDKDTS